MTRWLSPRLPGLAQFRSGRAREQPLWRRSCHAHVLGGTRGLATSYRLLGEYLRDDLFPLAEAGRLGPTMAPTAWKMALSRSSLLRGSVEGT